MSYTLETKKRKFNRVLDSISKPATQTPSPKDPPKDVAATASDPLTVQSSIKKVRLSGGPNDVINIKTSASRISRIPSDSTIVRPSFVPWDRERFLERLETFRRVDRWSPKPPTINEVEWAKRGWSCTDVMRVTCVGWCGGSVVVKLPDEIEDLEEDMGKVQERKEVHAKLVEEYIRLLAEGHSESCPWRDKGCDATIHRLPLTNPDIAMAGLRKRYLNATHIGPKLPSQDSIETPENLYLAEYIRVLPPYFLQPEETITDPKATDPKSQEDIGASSKLLELQIDRTAFALVLFGWDVAGDGSAGLVECRACFRRLGLWMYKRKANGDVTVYQKLSVVDEHMDYCPWVNPRVQSGAGKATERIEELHSGWELLAQAIRTKHRRCVRSVIVAEQPSKDSEAVSTIDYSTGDEETRKAKDKEWWAKLRRVRQALSIKSPKKQIPINNQ